MNPLCCHRDAQRRDAVREHRLTGLDWLEVDCAQRELHVAFIGPIPSWIGAENLRVTGGRRERDIRITEMRIERSDAEDLDDLMIVTVDRPGDYSTYRLEVVALDEQGRPTGRTPRGFDPRYTGIDFSFKASCASDQDPAIRPACPPPATQPAAISYLAKDYQSFRQLMLDRMALTAPDWTERHAPDLGITLVELLAYAADDLSYYQDAVATEAYLGTARKRESIRRHARLVDYRLDEGRSAQGWARLTLDGAETLALEPHDLMFTTALPGTTPAAAKAEAVRIPDDVLTFEPEAGSGTITLWASHNVIDFYDWGGSECCIPAGATRATLRDRGTLPAPDADRGSEARRTEHPHEEDGDLEADIREGRWHRLRLKAGDVLLLVEVLGPRTGDPADADPGRRHAVRLLSADYGWDPVGAALTVEISWCPEDALPFPLCLSTRTAAPECSPIDGVSVAYGNVVPVDHGRSITDPLEAVRVASSQEHCDEPCEPAEIRILTRRYRPLLPHGAPAFVAAPVDAVLDGCGGCGSHAASRRGAADSSPALPAIRLRSSPASGSGGQMLDWLPRVDLLDSEADDRHFVVETDDEGGASLRFGDGVHGRAPEAGQSFTAWRRIGGGTRGNIGADMLRHILFRNAFPDGVTLTVGNPLPMRGGRAPESTVSAKLRAPFSYRRRIDRAVTAEDYAAIVMRDFPGVIQRAAAVLRSTGVRVEVQVAVDRLGRFEVDPELLSCIERHLDRYRRAEHDIRVVPARYVPIDLAIEVCVAPGTVAEQVAQNARERLGAGPGGFFEADGLSFGDGIALSRLLAAVHAVEGVAHAHVTVLNRLYEAPDDELEAGLLPIGPDEIARLDQDPDAPENGRLSLDMKGGR